MEHKIVTLKEDLKGIPAGTKGTIIFEYMTGVYDVEFIVNGESVIEMLTNVDFES